MRIIVALSLLALAACEQGVSSAPTSAEAARADAAAQFPGVDVDGIVACVRANATEDELVLLSQGGAIGTQTTQSIMARASTQQCLRDSNVGLEEA